MSTSGEGAVDSKENIGTVIKTRNNDTDENKPLFVLGKYGQGDQDSVLFPSSSKNIYTDDSAKELQNNKIIIELKKKIQQKMNNVLEDHKDYYGNDPLNISDGFTGLKQWDERQKYKDYNWLNSTLTIDANILIGGLFDKYITDDVFKNPINLFNHHKLGLDPFNDNKLRKYPMTTILPGFKGINSLQYNKSTDIYPVGFDTDSDFFSGFRITPVWQHSKDWFFLSPDTMAFNIDETPNTMFSSGFMACLDWHDMDNPKLVLTYMLLVKKRDIYDRLAKINLNNNNVDLMVLLNGYDAAFTNADADWWKTQKKYVLQMFESFLIPDNSAASIASSVSGNGGGGGGGGGGVISAPSAASTTPSAASTTPSAATIIVQPENQPYTVSLQKKDDGSFGISLDSTNSGVFIVAENKPIITKGKIILGDVISKINEKDITGFGNNKDAILTNILDFFLKNETVTFELIPVLDNRERPRVGLKVESAASAASTAHSTSAATPSATTPSATSAASTSASTTTPSATTPSSTATTTPSATTPSSTATTTPSDTTTSASMEPEPELPSDKLTMSDTDLFAIGGPILTEIAKWTTDKDTYDKRPYTLTKIFNIPDNFVSQFVKTGLKNKGKSQETLETLTISINPNVTLMNFLLWLIIPSLVGKEFSEFKTQINSFFDNNGKMALQVGRDIPSNNLTFIYNDKNVTIENTTKLFDESSTHESKIKNYNTFLELLKTQLPSSYFLTETEQNNYIKFISFNTSQHLDAFLNLSYFGIYFLKNIEKNDPRMPFYYSFDTTTKVFIATRRYNIKPLGPYGEQNISEKIGEIIIHLEINLNDITKTIIKFTPFFLQNKYYIYTKNNKFISDYYKENDGQEILRVGNPNINNKNFEIGIIMLNNNNNIQGNTIPKNTEFRQIYIEFLQMFLDFDSKLIPDIRQRILLLINSFTAFLYNITPITPISDTFNIDDVLTREWDETATQDIIVSTMEDTQKEETINRLEHEFSSRLSSSSSVNIFGSNKTVSLLKDIQLNDMIEYVLNRVTEVKIYPFYNLMALFKSLIVDISRTQIFFNDIQYKTKYETEAQTDDEIIDEISNLYSFLNENEFNLNGELFDYRTLCQIIILFSQSTRVGINSIFQKFINEQNNDIIVIVKSLSMKSKYFDIVNDTLGLGITSTQYLKIRSSKQKKIPTTTKVLYSRLFLDITVYSVLSSNTDPFRIVKIIITIDLIKDTINVNLKFLDFFKYYELLHAMYSGEFVKDTNTPNGNGSLSLYKKNILDDGSTNDILQMKISCESWDNGIIPKDTLITIEDYRDNNESINLTQSAQVGGGKRSQKIKLSSDLNPSSFFNYENFEKHIDNEILEHNNKIEAKLAEITAIRKKTEDINRLVTTNKFVKPRPSLNKDSNKGMIVFQPDSEGRQYFYEGPIGLDKKPSNILYVSQQYGTIKQQLADNKTDVYISTGSPNRQNWYEFILKTRVTNYKEISDLPLQWTSYSTEFGFDMLTQSSVPGFFTKELLETIGKTTNIDNALFSDKVRLLKILEQVYIEAIIYMSAFILMLKKYKDEETDPKLSQFVDDALHNFAATESDASDTKRNYEVFIDFNSKISGKYLVTELPASEPASKPDTKDSNYNPAYDYSKAIIMPILSSLTPETSNLFKEINISTDTASNTNLIELLLILNKNIILILYMFTIVTANLGDACKTLLPNYDPLVVTPMFNLFKHIYEFIIKNAKPKPESISKDRKNMAIENNSNSIIEHNSNEVMRLLLMMAMLFDKQTYSGNPSKGNKSGGANIIMGKSKSKRKNIVKRKWKTKNKNRNTNINRNSNKNTKKYARVKIRKYTRK
jgi:hypothetical protein